MISFVSIIILDRLDYSLFQFNEMLILKCLFFFLISIYYCKNKRKRSIKNVRKKKRTVITFDEIQSEKKEKRNSRLYE
jgi:hypothetical protein